MDEKVYNEKRERLQKYVPFLEKLIKKMKEKTIPQHFPLLNKMEILYGLITASNKRLSAETLNKCESSLRNLYIKLSDKEITKEDFKVEILANELNIIPKTTNGKTTEPAPIKIKTEPVIKTEKQDEPEDPSPKASEPNKSSSEVLVKKEIEESSKRKSDVSNIDTSKKTKVTNGSVSKAVPNCKESNANTNLEETNKKVQKAKEPPKKVNPEPPKRVDPEPPQKANPEPPMGVNPEPPEGVNPEPEKGRTPKRKNESDPQSESSDIIKKIKVEDTGEKSKSSNAKVVILENKEIPKLHEGQIITKEMLGGILSNVLDSSLVKDLVEKIFAKPNEGGQSLKQRVKTEVDSGQIYEIFDDDDILLIEDDDAPESNKKTGEKVEAPKETAKTRVVTTTPKEKLNKSMDDISAIVDALTETAKKRNIEEARVVEEIIVLDEEESVVSQPNKIPVTTTEKTQKEKEIEANVIKDLLETELTEKIKEVLKSKEKTVVTNKKKNTEQGKRNETVGRIKDASKQMKHRKTLSRTNDSSKQEKQSTTIGPTGHASKQESVEREKQGKAVNRTSDASKQEKQSETVATTPDASKQESLGQEKQGKVVNRTSVGSNQESGQQEKHSKAVRRTSVTSKQESAEQEKQSRTVRRISVASKQASIEQGKQNKTVGPTSDATKQESVEFEKPSRAVRPTSEASKQENVEQEKQSKTARRTSVASKQASVEQGKQNKTVRRPSDIFKHENVEQGKQGKILRSTIEASKPGNVEQEKESKTVKQISDATKQGKQNKTVKHTSDTSKQESVEQEKQNKAVCQTSDTSNQENVEQENQSSIVLTTSDASKQGKQNKRVRHMSDTSKLEGVEQEKQNKAVCQTSDTSNQENVEQEKQSRIVMTTSGASKQGKQNKRVRHMSDTSKLESVEQEKQNKAVCQTSDTSNQENVEQEKQSRIVMTSNDASKQGKHNKKVRLTNDTSKLEGSEQEKQTKTVKQTGDASKQEIVEQGKKSKTAKRTSDASKQGNVEQEKQSKTVKPISDASKAENLEQGMENTKVRPTIDASKQENLEQGMENKKVRPTIDASKQENLEQGMENKTVRPTSDALKAENMEKVKQSKTVQQTSDASIQESVKQEIEDEAVRQISDMPKQEHVEQEKQNKTVTPAINASKLDEKKKEEQSKLEEGVRQTENIRIKDEINDDDDNKQIGKVKKLENNNLKITLKRKKDKVKTKAAREEKRMRKENARKSGEIDITRDDLSHVTVENAIVNVEVFDSPEEVVEEVAKEIVISDNEIVISNDSTPAREDILDEKVEVINVQELDSNEESDDKDLIHALEPLVEINDGTENVPNSYIANETTAVVPAFNNHIESLSLDYQHQSADEWITDEEVEIGTKKARKKKKNKDSETNKKKKKNMPIWPSFGSKKKKNKVAAIAKKLNFDLNNFNVARDMLPKKYEIDVTLFKYDFKHLKNNKMKVRDFEILQKQVEGDLTSNKVAVLKNTDINMLPDVMQCALCPQTDRFLPSHYVRYHSDSEVLVSRLPIEDIKELKDNLNNIPERVNKLQYKMMCQFCKTELTFTTRAWRSHYMRHTGEYQFKCTTCNIHASQTSRFVNHKAYCQNPDIVQIRVWERSVKNVDAYVCDSCNYIQMQEEGLKKHISTQHDTPVTYTHVILVNVLALDKQYNSPLAEPPKKVQFIPNTNRDVHLKNQIYRRQCVLCEYNGPYIVKHYVNVHYDAELFIARLSPETLETLMNDMNNVAFKQNNEFLHVHVFQYKCPFCDLHFIFPARSWLEHLGEHTGECKYQCKLCWRTANRIEDFKHYDKCSHIHIRPDDEIYKKMKYIQYAFVCAFCNFTQLNRKRVENHLRLQHNFQLENIEDKIFEVALLKFEGYDRFSNPFGDTNPEMEFNEEIMGPSVPVVVSQTPVSPVNSHNHLPPLNPPNAPRSEDVWPYQNGVSLDQYGIVLTDDSTSSNSLPMGSPPGHIDTANANNVPDSPTNRINSTPIRKPSKVGSQNLNATITKPVVQSVSPMNIAPSQQNTPTSSNNSIHMSSPVTPMNTTNPNAQVVRYTASRQSDSFIDLTRAEEERMAVSRQIEHKLPGQCIIRKVKNIGFCKDGTRQFYCLIQGCNFSTSMSYIIRDHISKDHPRTVWDSYCFDCKGFTLLKRQYSCVTEYKHMLDMHVVTDRIDKAKSTFIITQYKDGHLPIKRVSNVGYTINEDNKLFLYCLAEGCKVKTPHMYTLVDHIDKVHQSVLWDHYCEMCNRFVAPKSYALLRKELQHLQEKHTCPLNLQNKISPESSNNKQQPVPPIVTVQPRLPTKSVMAQPRTLNNSLRTSICNGATSVTSITNSVTLISKTPNAPKPTLKVRRLSGDNLSAQKALESARATTNTDNIPPLAPQQNPMQVRLPNGGTSSVVIKQILPSNGQEQHKATVQPQQMQNHMLTPDHINSNDIPDVPPIVYVQNPVKPWTKSLSVKAPEAAQKQLQEVCLYALFKCMGSNCTYVTSCIENMRKHLGYHEQAELNSMSTSSQSFYECPYCSLSILNITRLLDHIKVEHARDIYQCPYCFYRSCDAQNVLTHLRLQHRDKNHLVLVCNGAPRTLEAEFSMVMSSLKTNVDPLQCMKCRLNFFIIKSYVDHMTQIHGSQTNDGTIDCGMCIRVKSSPDNLIKHLLSTHKKGYYECVYCDFATNTFDLMAPHLAHVHNSRLPYVCVRKPKNESEVPMAGKQTLSNSTMLTCVVEQIDASRVLKCPFTEQDLIYVNPMSRNNNYNSSACSSSPPSFQNLMMAQQRMVPPTIEQIKSRGGLQISPLQMPTQGKQSMMPMNGQIPMSNVAPVRPQGMIPNMPPNRQGSSTDMSAYNHQYAYTPSYQRSIFYPNMTNMTNMMQPNTMLPR